jgi:hypothetical protein
VVKVYTKTVSGRFRKVGTFYGPDAFLMALSSYDPFLRLVRI